MSKMSRDKGARIEREIVAAHGALGIKAERCRGAVQAGTRATAQTLTQKPMQPVRWQQSDRFRNR